jgi:hypothetical protein
MPREAWRAEGIPYRFRLIVSSFQGLRFQFHFYMHLVGFRSFLGGGHIFFRFFDPSFASRFGAGLTFFRPQERGRKLVNSGWGTHPKKTGYGNESHF